MKAKKTIKQGLCLAAGVFAGNALFGVKGVITGFIAAALILVIYSVIALCQSDVKSDEKEKI